MSVKPDDLLRDSSAFSKSLIYPYYVEYCENQRTQLQIQQDHQSSTALTKLHPVDEVSFPKNTRTQELVTAKRRRATQNQQENDERAGNLTGIASTEYFDREEQCNELSNQLLKKEQEINRLETKIKRMESNFEAELRKEREARNKAEAHFHKVQQVWLDERANLKARMREMKKAASSTKENPETADELQEEEKKALNTRMKETAQTATQRRDCIFEFQSQNESEIRK